MKKVMMFAVMALMAVSAQAVSIEWDGEAFNNTAFSITKGQSFSVVVAGTAGASGGGAMFTVKQGSSSEVGFRRSNATTWWTFKDGANNKVSSDQTIAGGEKYVFAMIFTQGETALNVDYYANGSAVGSTTWGSLDVINFTATSWNDASYFDTTSAAIYNGALTTDNMDYLVTNNTAVLPEPTALALLALGVAGVALKRKMK